MLWAWPNIIISLIESSVILGAAQSKHRMVQLLDLELFLFSEGSKAL